MSETNEKNNPNEYFRDVEEEELESLAECTICYTVVLDKIEHLKWHTRLNKHLKKLGEEAKNGERWDWPPEQ